MTLLKHTAIGIALGVSLIAAVLAASCATASGATAPPDPYPGMRVVEEGGQCLYAFAEGCPKLLVYLDGSGTGSVLGTRRGGAWVSTGFARFLANGLGEGYALAVPERPGLSPGEDGRGDAAFMEAYTVENLVDAYCAAVRGYVRSGSFEEVCLLGASEGGLLAPRVFNELKGEVNFSRLVVIGAGGYGQDDCFRVLAGSPVAMPAGYRAECSKVDEVVDALRLGASEGWYLGWPYARWRSFFSYRPIDEYVSIDAPTLFVQGCLDYSSPVESVRFVEATFPDHPYDYWYFADEGHLPASEDEIALLIGRVFEWLSR